MHGRTDPRMFTQDLQDRGVGAQGLRTGTLDPLFLQQVLHMQGPG